MCQTTLLGGKVKATLRIQPFSGHAVMTHFEPQNPPRYGGQHPDQLKPTTWVGRADQQGLNRGGPYTPGRPLKRMQHPRQLQRSALRESSLNGNGHSPHLPQPQTPDRSFARIQLGLGAGEQGVQHGRWWSRHGGHTPPLQPRKTAKASEPARRRSTGGAWANCKAGGLLRFLHRGSLESFLVPSLGFSPGCNNAMPNNFAFAFASALKADRREIL